MISINVFSKLIIWILSLILPHFLGLLMRILMKEAILEMNRIIQDSWNLFFLRAVDDNYLLSSFYLNSTSKERRNAHQKFLAP
jgi:hypothetical protein